MTTEFLPKPKGYEHFDPAHLPSDMRDVLQLQYLIEQHFRVQRDPRFYAAKINYSFLNANNLGLNYFGKSFHKMIQDWTLYNNSIYKC